MRSEHRVRSASQQIEHALREADVRHEVRVYDGAGHGFFCDERDAYHPDAAADAVDAKNDFLLEATGRDAKARRDSLKRDVEDDADAPDGGEAT